MNEGPFTLQDAGQAWCNEKTKNTVMDADLAKAFVDLANSHPFVKEARLVMTTLFNSEDSSMETRHRANTFLTRWFPGEKK